MVYILGPVLDQSGFIARRLGINPVGDIGNVVENTGIVVKKEDLPIIMICSGGTCHGATQLLSEKLRKAEIPVDVKVIFDRHSDFRLNGHKTPERYYYTHAFNVYRANYLQELHILGIDEHLQSDFLDNL